MNADADAGSPDAEEEQGEQQLLLDKNDQEEDTTDGDELEDLVDDDNVAENDRPQWRMGCCYLCLFVVASVSSAWFRVLERQPPPERIPVQSQREIDFDSAGQYLTATRTFTLVVKPLISAQDQSRDDTSSINVGDFYNELEDRGFSFTELEQWGQSSAGDPGPLLNHNHVNVKFLRAVARLAMAWIDAEAAAIFHEISNVQYMGPLLDHYGEGYVRFQRMERDGDFIRFHLEEVSPGSASLKFLRQLEEEVRTGGDTWDCGDFGDVTWQIARRNRFAGLWESSLAFTDPARVRMRVSFSADMDPHVLDSEGNRIPKPEPQRCQSYDYYSYQEPYFFARWLPF